MRRPGTDYDHHILTAIASGRRITQRSLSEEMGVALGLTNLLMRRLVAKGYVKISGMGSRHVLYLMTAAGWKALGHATRVSLENTVHLYTQTREQIRSSLSAVSERCEMDADGLKPVVFYGAGDVAEITYVSLQRTDLTLIGVVDDHRRGQFFGLEICAPERLTSSEPGGLSYAQVVVTSVKHAQRIHARLDVLGIPTGRVSSVAPEFAVPASTE
jgi:DNA-binding MarR family transcriptional regulator